MKTRCGGDGQWLPLTDPQTTTVTELRFTVDCAATSNQYARLVHICMVAHLNSDPEYPRALAKAAWTRAPVTLNSPPGYCRADTTTPPSCTP